MGDRKSACLTATPPARERPGSRRPPRTARADASCASTRSRRRRWPRAQPARRRWCRGGRSGGRPTRGRAAGRTSRSTTAPSRTATSSRAPVASRWPDDRTSGTRARREPLEAPGPRHVGASRLGGPARPLRLRRSRGLGWRWPGTQATPRRQPGHLEDRGGPTRPGRQHRSQRRRHSQPGTARATSSRPGPALRAERQVRAPTIFPSRFGPPTPARRRGARDRARRGVGTADRSWLRTDAAAPCRRGSV